MVPKGKVYYRSDFTPLFLSSIRTRNFKYIQHLNFSLTKPHLSLPSHLRKITLKKLNSCKRIKIVTFHDLPYKEFNFRTTYFFPWLKKVSQHLENIRIFEWENRSVKNPIYNIVGTFKRLKSYKPTLSFGNFGPKEYDFYKIRLLENLTLVFDYPAPNKNEIKQLCYSISKCRSLKNIKYQGNLLFGKEFLLKLSKINLKQCIKYYFNVFNSYPENSKDLQSVFQTFDKNLASYVCKLSLIMPEDTKYYLSPIGSCSGLVTLTLDMNIQNEEEISLISKLESLQSLKFLSIHRSIYTMKLAVEKAFGNLRLPPHIQVLRLAFKQLYQGNTIPPKELLDEFLLRMKGLNKLKSLSFALWFEGQEGYNLHAQHILAKIIENISPNILHLEFLSHSLQSKENTHTPIDLGCLVSKLENFKRIQSLHINSPIIQSTFKKLEQKILLKSLDLQITSKEKLAKFHSTLLAVDHTSLSELKLEFSPDIVISPSVLNKVLDVIGEFKNLTNLHVKDVIIHEWKSSMKKSLLSMLERLGNLNEIKISISAKEDFDEDPDLLIRLQVIMSCMKRLTISSFYLFGRTYKRNYSLALYKYDAYRIQFVCPTYL
mgnify:CR=1 FL=1